MSKRLYTKLSKVYYDPKNPASYSGVNKLYTEIKKDFPEIKLIDVKKWLSSQFTYTLHHPSRKQFIRNKIIVNKIDQQWEADLVDMKEFSKENDNYTFILTVIDTFSKFAFVEVMKQKTAQNVVKAFKKILKSRKCSFLRTDKGTEFCNKLFQKFLKTQNVRHFTSNNDDIKCAIVERFNRTLKTKMFKYFTSKGNRRYVDILQNLVTGYNKSRHRTIKMAPCKVSKANENLVFRNIYGYKNMIELLKNNRKPIKKTILKPGNKVRRKYTKNKLDKGYYPTWGDKIYTVTKSIKGNPRIVYKIKDEKNNNILQRLYSDELQKVEPGLDRVEKILKTRTRKGKKEYFVKWTNHPDEHNSWVENIKWL